MNAPQIRSQMRLCWSASVSHVAHDIARTNVWQTMSAIERFDLEIMMRAGNEVYGPNTHWIELRQYPEDGEQPSVSLGLE